MGTDAQVRPLISPAEAAVRLGVSIGTVRRLLRSGALPAYQLGPPGASVRIDPAELQEWLRSEDTGGAAA